MVIVAGRASFSEAELTVDGAISRVRLLRMAKKLVRQTSGEGVFHGFPTRIATAHRTKTACLGTVPDLQKFHCIGHLLRLFGRQNLLNTNLINEVFAL